MKDNLQKNFDSRSTDQNFINVDKKQRLVLDRSKSFINSEIQRQKEDDLMQHLEQKKKRLKNQKNQVLINPKLLTTEITYKNDTKILLNKFSFRSMLLWVYNILFGYPLSKVIVTMFFISLTIVFFCLYFLPLAQYLVFLIIGIIFLIISLMLLSYFIYLLF